MTAEQATTAPPAFRITLPDGSEHELKPGDKYLTVTQGMSGYFALIVWINPGTEPGLFGGAPLGPFQEPWDTGIGRYATAREAWDEVAVLHETEDIIMERRPTTFEA